MKNSLHDGKSDQYLQDARFEHPARVIMLSCAIKRKLLSAAGVHPNLYRAAFSLLYPCFTIGYGTYGQPDIREWGEGAKLTIGSYCSIADNVVIFLGGEHRPDWVTTYPFSEKWRCAKHYKGHPKTKGDVVIGHDVWIGSNATILSGVSIGSGAVIGCHAVVGRDVEPYSIVCGNPAKLIRKRFSDEVISQLLEINWWLWPREAVAEGMSMLLSNNVEEFIRYAMEEVRTMRDGGVFK